MKLEEGGQEKDRRGEGERWTREDRQEVMDSVFTALKLEELQWTNDRKLRTVKGSKHPIRELQILLPCG